MIIADSGQKKTAMTDNAFAVLRNLDAIAWRSFTKRRREWKSLSKSLTQKRLQRLGMG
jgi:hypothetical protein